MDKMSKREKITAYKERTLVGGVYIITNSLNQKVWLDAAIDLQGSLNRFDFSQKTGICVVLKLQTDWRTMGKSAFSLTVLETIEKPLEQSQEAFKEDIQILKSLWFEKLSPTTEWY